MVNEENNLELYKLLNEVSVFSHAYLFDSVSNEIAYPYVLKLAKKIICNNRKECDNCNICHLIDNNSYEDFYLINPDTVSINKDEIDKLLYNFKTKALTENAHRVYIIYGFDRMDEYVSNKILKFLEEPEENIHAFLLTENINKILPTIKSRCQIIKINIENKEFNEDKFIKAKDFLEYIFNNQTKTIAYTNELCFNNFSERQDIKEMFIMMESILINEINNRYQDKGDYLNISLENIYKIIEIIENLSNLINYNINLNLLIDRFIIEISEVIKCKK